MSAIVVLKIIASLSTIATGAYSLLWPARIKGFTGLDVTGPRGITEIRAILGAFFIGLGASALLLNSTAAYQMLGITYLVVAITRSFSMFVDRSVSQSNIVSVLAEVILGVILVA
jgi:uncharacterized protein DUF4345